MAHIVSGPLNERKKLILKAIIEAHVQAGCPVGSKYLTQNQQIGLSSATIRNEMAELEALGFLEQPHTSAGRVPSENGYRFYVDSLMQEYRMTAAELKRLNAMMRSRISEFDTLLERATKAASALTNYTALSIKPKQRTVHVSHFKTMYLGSNLFLLVMLMSTGAVETRQLNLAFSVTEETIRRLEEILNTYVAGVDPDSITVPMIVEMEGMLPEGEALIGPIVKCVYGAVSDMDSGDLHCEGVNLLLQYPEYSDIDRFKSLLDVLERKDDILNLFSGTDRDKVQIFIGSENAVDIMNTSSLLFKSVVRDGRVVGAIGVLGPCRMDYSRVITTLEALANAISDGGEAGLPSPEEAHSGFSR